MALAQGGGDSGMSRSSPAVVPLDGMTVVDFSQAASGPFCTQILSDLGARVLKIEPPEGDMIRGWNDAAVSGVGTYFMGLNRGKESVCVDLRKPAGLEIAKTLVRRADIVVQNYRPGVVERLGIDYPAVQALNPRVVYLSISGYGHDGPRAQDPAMDIIIQAVGGIMGITGEQGQAPVKVGAPVADLATGWAASSAALAAVVARERFGTGQHVEISMLDVVMTLLSNHATGFLMTGKPVVRMGSGHPQLVPYQAFETSDGEYIIVGILNERFWRKFCQAIERGDWLDDPLYRDNTARVVNRSALVEAIAALIRSSDVAHWLALFAKFDVPVTQVASFETLFSDAQVAHNGMVRELVHDTIGAIPVLGSPFHFNGAQAALGRPPPLLGEHTAQVLHEFGYTRAAIEGLRDDGTIRLAT